MTIAATIIKTAATANQAYGLTTTLQNSIKSFVNLPSPMSDILTSFYQVYPHYVAGAIYGGLPTPSSVLASAGTYGAGQYRIQAF